MPWASSSPGLGKGDVVPKRKKTHLGFDGVCEIGDVFKEGASFGRSLGSSRRRRDGVQRGEAQQDAHQVYDDIGEGTIVLLEVLKLR